MVIAVPVKYSERIVRAQSTTPFSASQFAINKMLPSRRIEPINPNTMTFRIVRFIIRPPQKGQSISIQVSANWEKAQGFSLAQRKQAT
jgi:hypothetical protein